MKFQTLKVEMMKRGIKPADIAKVLEVSLSTAYTRLAGTSPLLLSEASKVRNEHFPEFTLEELFSLEKKGA